MKRLVFVVFLAGCSVVDAPYPAIWDPIWDARAPDCRRFAGTYADRGEAPGQTARPSLTRELFGQGSPWEKAASLRIELTPEGATVSVSGPAQPFVHHFSAKEGDFRCDGGKLILRHQRWIASGLMSGRESVKASLFEADPFLVAHVEERTTGVMFMVVPLSGEAARWFRFARLKP